MLSTCYRVRCNAIAFRFCGSVQVLTFSNNAYSKRLVFSLFLLVLIAMTFWTQSRFPDLNDKALMGGGIILEDPLSFEASIPIDPADPIAKRIIYTTYNWIMTNRRGMTFGILFGAAFLTMLRYLPRRSWRNGFVNATMGFFIGAPLGVCVNCAAPIARGMYSGGTRLETTLAAMIASPTFNVIVLTMLFSIFPFYLVMTKIGLSLFVILIAIPIICRFVPVSELQVEDSEVSACIIDPIAENGSDEPYSRAFVGFARDCGHDLWFIVRKTVPLMLLAGFLGATIATLLPVSLIQSVSMTALTLLGFSVVGVFLPVPIAFDVVLAAALLASGAPVGIVMVFLFTLGIFSIYSFLIVAGSISFRASAYLTVTIIALGFSSSYIAESYNKWQIDRTLELLNISFDFSLMSSAHAAEAGRATASTIITDSGTITVTQVPFEPRSPAGAKPFSRFEAWKIGIDRANEFSIADMHSPFSQTPGSVSAADIDNDGDPDVVMADNYEGGIDIFVNDGAGQFAHDGLDLPKLANMPVTNAAPVDLNNDGWLDLFITTYDDGNYILWSDAGRFSDNRLQPVANRADAVLSISLAFGDVDKDGDLDVVLGNQSATPIYSLSGERNRNRIVINHNGNLDGSDFVDTTGTPGETLSILLSDFDQDGDLDLIEGNDFDEPDEFYLGNGKGDWREISRQDSIIPIATHTTMSVKTADLDNDLDFEIYLSQIAGRSQGVSERLRMTGWDNYCKDIERSEDRETCQTNIDIKGWYPSGGGLFLMGADEAKKCFKMEAIKHECVAVAIRDIAIRADRPELCDEISPQFRRQRMQCKLLTTTTRTDVRTPPKEGRQEVYIGPEQYAEDIPQYFGGNVLLVKDADGSYKDLGKPSKLDIGGWSWDIKIFDFDHDGLQDVHILNGSWVPHKVAPSNIFMRNLGNLAFDDKTEEFGLVDFMIVSGAAAADFDNDGDIDEIAQTINGPVFAYWNNSQTGNTVAIELRDYIDNRFGIGSKVTLSYGDTGEEMQIRELQLGGGYGSFDEAALHFGLGEFSSVSRIKIDWPGGGETTLEGPFAANATYTIERRPVSEGAIAVD